jgi:iron only hydrogenase large subunit-like protein
MKPFDFIKTGKVECQDCNKCIRECPVKAIRVEDAYAQVVPELCVLCGNCILACPSKAKQVCDDLPTAKALLKSGRAVIASLSPSFAAQFPGVRPEQLIHALKQLGFFAVSEAALGAEQVEASILALMSKGPKQIWISSACPSVVDYICKYHPECLPHLCSVLSPVLTHCKMLRARYGDDLAIISIGPCVAEKKEAEEHPELLDLALTYEDLDSWLIEKKIHPAEIAVMPDDRFEPRAAQEGAFYAIEGGMAQGITGGQQADNLQFVSISGIANVEAVLKDIANWNPEQNIFIEMNACSGACINGPMAARDRAIARRRDDILRYAKPAGEFPRPVELDITQHYAVSSISHNEYTEMQLQEALHTVGKYSEADELNCASCGYDTCRDFARALIDGNAERLMCATYTRRMAQKKANALLQRMPSAVVIADENMKIIECNPNFAHLFTTGAEQPKNLEGSILGGVMPFDNLFRRVLDSGEDIVGHDLRYQQSILYASIFVIEPHAVIGGIFQDITEPTFQKEQIIGRAQEVIRKNMKTVQQIAYLLGENAADSEIILNSIVHSFSPEEAEDSGDGEKP